MLKRSINWTASLLASTLGWCQRIVGRLPRFSGRTADQLETVRKEDQFEASRIMNPSHPIHLELAGKRVELMEFAQVLNIGDRIRVFCDDGVLIAEKISQTQLRIVQAEKMAEGVH